MHMRGTVLAMFRSEVSEIDLEKSVNEWIDATCAEVQKAELSTCVVDDHIVYIMALWYVPAVFELPVGGAREDG